ncbi:uracil-DNA glycosylase [Candidatus Viridilinea mediisalina]|uniref:Uracil-DNA glycosylase-like domain-containing protein n=1 Tax=Candidatus Viridilinea mediisalina TaxID=2024553 RepID=A0A2A6RJU7_9CHLR|nr:uracil-DNA glycosylase [Candidatus Viridilinea mediisalina]PDW03211.1 hypothetical protein CJ255_09825 [Candidatus Viridilinea mediisalina]
MPQPNPETLVASVAELPAPPATVNMYALEGPSGNVVRRANLRLALALARERGPNLLLIGEAPGYNGALRTGVPFTSERLLLAGLPSLGQFGRERGFALATDDGRISAEQTATLVYRELVALNCFVAGWNAYPLHPHRPDKPQSNRPPRAAELAQGLPLLQQFLALFPAVPVAAMGNVAAQSLSRLAIAHVKVRHPAQGGARQFAAELRALVHMVQS